MHAFACLVFDLENIYHKGVASIGLWWTIW